MAALRHSRTVDRRCVSQTWPISLVNVSVVLILDEKFPTNCILAAARFLVDLSKSMHICNEARRRDPPLADSAHSIAYRERASTGAIDAHFGVSCVATSSVPRMQTLLRSRRCTRSRSTSRALISPWPTATRGMEVSVRERRQRLVRRKAPGPVLASDSSWVRIVHSWVWRSPPSAWRLAVQTWSGSVATARQVRPAPVKRVLATRPGTSPKAAALAPLARARAARAFLGAAAPLRARMTAMTATTAPTIAARPPNASIDR